MAFLGRPLRKTVQAYQDKAKQHCRRRVAAECQSAGVERLVKKIADYGTKGARKNECGPENRV